MKILFAIPSPDFVSPSFAFGNLHGLISHTQKSLGCDITLAYQQGVRTDRNRNIMLHKALQEGDFDYILWLDADMMYPFDMVEKYVKADKDIIGCLYFKRAYPHAPIGYTNSDDPKKPYRPLDYRKLPEDSVIEVSALGFGGVLVKTSVYEAMGDDKWCYYSENFHLPYLETKQQSHDMVFCELAKKHGFKIHLHTGVRPGHIGEKIITQDDWDIQACIENSGKRVAVIMPTINPEKAQEAMDLMIARADYPFQAIIVEDFEKNGFISTVNSTIRDIDADYYVYTAEDAHVGREWLKRAMDTITKEDGGLLAFNDGKWGGQLAAFGLVKKDWMVKNYGGDLFFEGYNSHYADMELSVLAHRDGKMCYNPEATMIEVDYLKEEKMTNHEDKMLFAARAADAPAKDKKFWGMFS